MEGFVGELMQSSFSIAVASYLLVKMDKRMEELTRAVINLSSVIEAKEKCNG